MRRLEGYNVELTQTLEFGQQKSRRAADEKVRFPPLQMRVTMAPGEPREEPR